MATGGGFWVATRDSRFGKYAYGRAVKESFLEALIRPKNQELEEGWFYQDEIMPQMNGKEIKDS